MPSIPDRLRRAMLRAALATPAALASRIAPAAGPDNWPTRPVRILVQFGPGSASDMHARMVAEELQAAFRQPFLVENKPGASGMLAADLVAKAAPDGHTLLLTTNTASSINPFLFRKLPYDPIKDFTPVARLTYMPFLLLVSGDSPLKTVRELVAHARANPTSYGYANATGQVAGATLAAQGGFQANAVPYKSTPAAMTDLIGGHFTFMIGDLGSASGLIANNKVRPLAVITARRSALAPALPSVQEALPSPDFDLPTWIGILGPAGMPAPIVQALNARINQMLGRKGTAEKLAVMGAEAAPASPSELEGYMKQQLDVWRVKVRGAGIVPQ